MNEEKRKVLEMVAEGTITQEDAARLLEALGEGPAPAAPEQLEQEVPAEERNEPQPEPTFDEQMSRLGDSIGETVEKAIGGAAEGLKEMKKTLQSMFRKNTVSPKLTLEPDDNPEEMADAIVAAVEKTMEEAFENGVPTEEELNRRIDDAVTEQVNRTFGGEEPQLADVPEIAWEPDAGNGSSPYALAFGEQEVEDVFVNWVSGPVELRRGRGDRLVVTEYATRPLSEEEKMQITLNGGKLKIGWMKKKPYRSLVAGRKLAKRLVIELPASQQELGDLKLSNVSGNLLAEDLSAGDVSFDTVSGAIHVSGLRGDDISFTAVSGGVYARDISADDFKVKSTSGVVSVAGLHAEDVKVSSTSGRVELSNLEGEDVNVNTTSGKADLTGCTAQDVYLKTVSGMIQAGFVSMPEDLHASSISGRLVLSLPDDPRGFTVKYSTTSGPFHSDFPLAGRLEKRGGEAAYAQGETDIVMSTVSGGMELHRQ